MIDLVGDRPGRVGAPVAWLCWLLAVSLAAASWALGWQPEQGDWWLNLPLALGYPLAGAVILTSRPGHPVGRLLTGIGLAAAVAIASHQYATRAIVLEPGSLPAASVAAWLGSWIWVLGAMPAMTLVPLLLPDGRLPSRRWRPIAWAAGVAIAAGAVGFGLAPGRLVDFPSVQNPVGIEAIGPVAGVLQGVTFPLALVATVGALTSLVVRWRSGGEETRRQLRPIVVAMALFVSAVIVAGLADPPLGVSASVNVGAALLVPAAIVAGVLQRRLFGVRTVLEPSLVYLAVSSAVLATYVTAVLVVGRLAGQGAALVLATAAVALGLQPAHRRIQHGIARLLHGDRDDPDAAVARLVSHLALCSPPSLLGGTAAGIADALGAPGARVTVADADGRAAEASWGAFMTGTERYPVAFYDGIVGQVEVARRAPGVPFGRADRRVLERLEPHVGTAMHVVSLAAGLNAAREQAVLAREEERRRIRRDLHDGLGPGLAGLGLGVEGVADLVHTDPDRAREVLGELAAAVHATIDDVRRLVYDLRPPALDDLGLVGALREQANSMARHGGTVVSLDVPDELPELPAAVEVAVYRIAMEALTNVARHAGACRCSVSLRVDGAVELSVEDDGAGFDGATGGLGLVSMRERVAELNGQWSVERLEPHGTCVRARLPVGAP
jgi:signal transduction histidine kinase